MSNDTGLKDNADLIFENVLDAVLEARKLDRSDDVIAVFRRDGSVTGTMPIERIETDMINYPPQRQTIALVMGDERIIMVNPVIKKMFLARCEEGELKVVENERGALTIPGLRF